jgi:hypothetical protein
MHSFSVPLSCPYNSQAGRGEGLLTIFKDGLVLELTEVKEHDVSPEDLDPIKEEPHHQEARVDAEEGGSALPSADLESSEHADERGVSGFLSGFAAAVQSTVSQYNVLVCLGSYGNGCLQSQGLVSGGLGALETLGKKTMEVLSEGDPGMDGEREVGEEGGFGKDPLAF